MKGTVLITVLAVIVLTGCVHVHPPGEEALPVQLPEEWVAEQGNAGAPTGWLADFDDRMLPLLVEEALGSNLSLQAAMARLEQASALARIEGADRWPDLSVGGSARRAMTNTLSEPLMRTRSDRFGVEAIVNWEVDLWGRVRAQVKAAEASYAAAESDFAAVRLSLATRVAQSWFTVLEAQLQAQLAGETLRTFESSLTTVDERFQRGLSPALDLRLTRANVASARATLALQERLADAAIRQLEVLLGRYPAGQLAELSDGSDLSDPLDLPATIPAGLPAELLGRRPDIQAAALRLMAADAGLIESRRALLPGIGLTGSYGSASADLENLLKSPFDVWSLAGNVTAPLFAGGRLRGNVDRAEAVREEALASYQEAVLTAFQEVESGLAGEAFLRDQLEALRLAAEESTGAQELAEERYERGLSDIITVLEAQRRAFNARSAALTVQNLLLQNRLALYLALGGDFN